MTVADRIKKRREQLGITQDELAERLNLKGKSSVCKIEKAGDNISTKSIVRYALALECSPCFLMGWSEEINSRLTDQEKRLLAYFAQLNDTAKGYALADVKRYTSIPAFLKDTTKKPEQMAESFG